MSEVNFAVGDVVQLKSGGPKMTILELMAETKTTSASARCVWFDVHGGIHYEVLPFVVLTRN